jgi:tetratricopeptide (TPR) repeat protein
MRNASLVIRSLISLPAISLCVFAQSPAPAPKAPPAAQSAPAPAQSPKINVFVGSDERIFVALAALNLAGFTFETPNAPPNQLREALKKDLQATPPDVTARLKKFYAGLSGSEQNRGALAASVIALAVAVGPAPNFAPPPNPEDLPEDVRPLVGFAPLLAEFYAKSPIKTLIPKYAANYNAYADLLQQLADQEAFQTLAFLHTQPILSVTEGGGRAEAAPESGGAKKKGAKEKNSAAAPIAETKTRIRRLFIFPDLFGPFERVYTRNDVLNGSDAKTFRRIGDDYVFVLGPQRELPRPVVRRVLTRFLLEPVVARAGVAIAQRRPEITGAYERTPKPDPVLRNNVFEIVRESLDRAVEARLELRTAQNELRNDAGSDPEKLRAAVRAAEDDALLTVGAAYERGAAMSFHFYEQLQTLDQTGVDILDWLPKMIESFNVEREGKRGGELAELRARAEKRRTEIIARVAPNTTILSRLEQADDLIRARRYADAKPLLEAVAGEDAKNARATFGLAQIAVKQLSPVELDPNGDESDKLAAQGERFEKALALYEKAIGLIQPEEKWIASQAYVMIGRLYDIAQRREEALAAYEKALAIGEVKDGAYREALEGKTRPFGDVPR